jgi:hypothetical protein
MWHCKRVSLFCCDLFNYLPSLSFLPCNISCSGAKDQIIVFWYCVFVRDRCWLSGMPGRRELITKEEWNLSNKMSSGKQIKEDYVKDSVAAIKDRPELLEMLVECKLDRRVQKEEKAWERRGL